MVLEEQGVKEFVENRPTTPTNPQQLAQHNKNDARARRLILEGVKEHIVPHLSGKNATKETWTAIMNLY